MAKSRNVGSSTSKMTVMVFQFEGDDATLQEGLRTVSAALSRALPAPRQLLTHAAAAPASGTNGDVAFEDALEIDSGGSEVDEVSAARASKRTYRSPQILDIDLASGPVTLKDFLTKHPTDETQKRYLLIAYWLKVNRELEAISADHIHTCFRHMSWHTPKDAIQPFRDMKSKLGWFHKGDERGYYKVNHIGENVVLQIIEGKS